MSNILIIKHGSLGDIAQISGVLRDIREIHNNKKIFPTLLSRCINFKISLSNTEHGYLKLRFINMLKFAL